MEVVLRDGEPEEKAFGSAVLTREVSRIKAEASET